MTKKPQPTNDMDTANASSPVADVSDHNDSNSEIEPNTKNVSDEIEWLPIEELVPDEKQPRKYFDPTEIRELADSIKSSGIIQPILYKDDDGKKIVKSGERRLRAAREAGLEIIPCRKVIGDADLVGLIENMARKDLLPMEEALAVEKLKKDKGYTQAKLGKELGKSQNTISDILSLTKLPEDIQEEALKSPKWSRSILLNLSKIKDKNEQETEFLKIRDSFPQLPPEQKDNTSENEAKEGTTVHSISADSASGNGSLRTFNAGIKTTKRLHKQLDTISKFNQTNIESIPEDERNGFKEELKQLKRAIEKCIKNFSD